LSSDFPPLAILSNGNSGQGDNVVCAHLCPLSPLYGAVEFPALAFGQTASPLRRGDVDLQGERGVLVPSWSDV
jgi:hypothetical protein